MNFLKAAGIVILLALLAGVGFVYSGQFDPAADAPHSRPVYWLMENLRHRGIESRVSGITVPDLQDPELLRSGA
ncbi:MAG: cytochrome c, partial [Gammaproteobacteria bacterium]